MSNQSSEFAYTGVDNLEVMLEAERYNAFLTELVIKYAPRGAIILDFGAGIGTFSEMVRDRGLGVDCLEIDAFQSDILKKKGFRVFPATQDIAPGSYDYIFSLNVFEHIEHDTGAMRETTRILRPGGTILTYVPAFQVLFGDMDRKVEHYRRYTRKSLSAVSEAAGLEVLHTEYVDLAGYFASLVYNMTSKGSGNINPHTIRLYDRYVFPLSRVFDRVTSSFVGKNVFCLARKPK